MSSPEIPSLRNAEAVPLTRVPRLTIDDFRAFVIGGPRRGERVAALFGVPIAGGAVELHAVVASEQESVLRLARAEPVDSSYSSMTPECPEVHLFEREIAEQLGIMPAGHPWLKPVRFPRGGSGGPVVGTMDYYRVEGEEVHEVAVGPVHAGVIEPGHFRFQCHGEHVFHLEISLGYQHRGVERALLGGPHARTIHHVETLAGDSSVAHATAHCQVVESLSRCRVPLRAQALRGVALELERLANHTGTLGALAGDVAFLPTASYCGRLRGEFLNLTAELCGSRFGRGMVRPGGVAFDVDAARVTSMTARLDAALTDIVSAVDLMREAPSVEARFEGTGPVSRDLAVEIGLVGVAARASGIERDVRHDFPAGIWRYTQIPVPVWHTGDVFARAHVRDREVRRSAAFVKNELARLPAGPVRSSARPGPLAPDHVVVSLVEGHRGEICHVALTDEVGRFRAYKIVDPSFHNWMGLALALRDQQISDFPLCNKSFDLSYCGFDL